MASTNGYRERLSAGITSAAAHRPLALATGVAVVALLLGASNMGVVVAILAGVALGPALGAAAGALLGVGTGLLMLFDGYALALRVGSDGLLAGGLEYVVFVAAPVVAYAATGAAAGALAPRWRSARGARALAPLPPPRRSPWWRALACGVFTPASRSGRPCGGP